MNMAVARTKVAVNSPARLRFPPACLVQRIGLLEDLQLFHGSPSQTPLYARWADGMSHPCWRMLCEWDFRHGVGVGSGAAPRSEEHTSELQSLRHLVCRLL